MDSWVKLLLGVVLAAPLAGILIWTWRWSPKEARKHLAQTLESGGVEFSPPVHAWLERHFVLRERLWQTTYLVGIFVAFTIAEWDPTTWRFVVTLLVLFAIEAGVSIALALRTLRRARDDRSTTRVAALRPRTVRSYLHPLESISYGLLLPLLGLVCVSLTITAWPGDEEQASEVLALFGAVIALLTLAALLLQRYLVRLPQDARDDEEQLACDLLVAIALRELLAGVVMPVLALVLLAWIAVVDAGGDLPPDGYVLGAIAVALIAAVLLLPSPVRRQQGLWRFRGNDRQVPA